MGGWLAAQEFRCIFFACSIFCNKYFYERCHHFINLSFIAHLFQFQFAVERQRPLRRRRRRRRQHTQRDCLFFILIHHHRLFYVDTQQRRQQSKKKNKWKINKMKMSCLPRSPFLPPHGTNKQKKEERREKSSRIIYWFELNGRERCGAYTWLYLRTQIFVQLNECKLFKNKTRERGKPKKLHWCEVRCESCNRKIIS